jgi:hypothetical protein
LPPRLPPPQQQTVSNTTKFALQRDSLTMEGGQEREKLPSEEQEYERALVALSSLISGRQRKDGAQWAHAFEMMQSYLEVR